jgi:hypothetical protein
MATVLAVLSVITESVIVENKPLNLAMRSSARSSLGPVTMQTLVLGV